jgi:hypothetical protein
MSIYLSAIANFNMARGRDHGDAAPANQLPKSSRVATFKLKADRVNIKISG